MKKQILLAALVLGGAMLANGQVTLTKDWSISCPLGASSARSGVGTNGKFYVIEQNKGVHVYDQTGQVNMIANSSAWVSVNCDDAGHVYFRNDVGGWAGPKGMGYYLQANAQFCVYDAVAEEMVAENVPMKFSWDESRFDALPHVYGNMANSPFNFVVPLQGVRVMYELAFQNLTDPNTAYYSEAPIAYYEQGGLAYPNSTTGITQQYDENHLAGVLNASAGQSYKGTNGNAIGIFEKTAAGQYTFKGYADTPKRSGVAGFHIFDCKGDKYIVYPTGQVDAASNASADGFAVAKLEIVDTPANSSSTPLAMVYAEIELGETYPRYFNVEPIQGENAKFKIYLYSPGKTMKVYTLDLSSLYPEEHEYSYQLFGNFGGDAWSAINLTETDGVWTSAETELTKSCTFGVRKLDMGEQIEWYGQGGVSYITEPGEYACAVTDQNFSILPGTYTFTFDPAQMKLTVAGTANQYYLGWYVNIKGDFNEWKDNGVQPNSKGITEHKGLALGTGGFKVKVYDGEDHWYSTGGAIETNKWVSISGNASYNMNVKGANTDSKYDVKYNVLENKIFLTEAVVGECSYELFGNFVDEESWSPITLSEEEGLWKSEKIVLGKDCMFGVRKMDGNTQVAWYGEGGVAEITESGDYACTSTDQNFSIVAGTYVFTFNPAEMNLNVVMFSAEDEFYNDYTFETTWRADMRSTNAINMRQGVGVDGKMYIVNTQYTADGTGWIEVWGENGFERKIEVEGGVNGTNITVDEAGNIIASTSKFPNTFVGSNTGVIITPEGVQKKFTINYSQFSEGGSGTGGRQDFWGHAKGNVMSDEGGCFTVGLNGAGHVDIKLVNGDYVGGESGRKAYYKDVNFPHSTTAVFHTYSFLTDAAGNQAALYQAGPNDPLKYAVREPFNGTYLWFIRDEFVSTDHNATIGSALFQLDGETYIVYSRGGNNADGIIIAKAKLKNGALNAASRKPADENGIVYKGFAETNANGDPIYNGGQYNHFNVEVSEDGKTAHIYQFVPGQFAAMHTLTVDKVSTGIEEVVVEEEEAIEVAPVYYNMQGVRVANPQNGLYIEVRGDKARKVLVR